MSTSKLATYIMKLKLNYECNSMSFKMENAALYMQ